MKNYYNYSILAIIDMENEKTQGLKNEDSK